MSKLGQQFCPKVTGSFSRYFRNPHICKRKTKEREKHHGKGKGGKKEEADASVNVRKLFHIEGDPIFKCI